MMRYLNAFFILITFFLVGCYENSKNEDVIEYSKLSELDIHVSIEITESEKFIPARLKDLIIAEDGSLIISDWGNMSIVHFDSDGTFKREIAEKGQGPGELKTFFSLIHSKRDTILVKFFGMSGQLDVYVRDNKENSFYYDYSLSAEIENTRNFNIIDAAPGFGYFAISENLTQNRSENLFDPPIYKSEILSIVNDSYEIVTDSVHALQSPSPLFIEAEGGAVTPIGVPPFLSRDRMKYLGNNLYLVARTRDGIIQIFNEDHIIQSEVVLDVQELHVSEKDLDNQLKNIPEQFQGELRERAGDLKPHFIDVWASKDYLLLHTDNNETGKEMVLLTRDGKAIGKFYLSEFDEIHELRDRKMYTLHKNQESGHSIRVYEVII